jgi:hypothetical protein
VADSALASNHYLVLHFDMIFVHFFETEIREFVQGPGIVEIGQIGVIILPWFFFPWLIICFFFFVLFGHGWWESWDYQTRYHSVQEFFFRLVGVWSEFFFSIVKYFEFDIMNARTEFSLLFWHYY